ncbi:hypothetical protein B0J14DRAFT_569188 [Halenospora varia]|nr:hypothetical protein B0J14DRAFT_569188 [Halenospora varia]
MIIGGAGTRRDASHHTARFTWPNHGLAEPIKAEIDPLGVAKGAQAERTAKRGSKKAEALPGPSGGTSEPKRLRERSDTAEAGPRASRQPAGLADFIIYEPPLHSDILTETPPEIGLRTSINILIPSRDDARQDDVPQCVRPISPPPTQLPTATDDPKLAEQIKQIRADEQESILERNEYDTEIANILLGMRSDNIIGNVATSELQEIEEAEAATIRETANKEESQRSCLT